MTDQFHNSTKSSSNTGSHRPLVIAIDGPSGSGKSSTARGVADRLGLAFLDTGAMYRAITWLALEEGVDLDDREAVAELLTHASLDIDMDPRRPVIVINGMDVSEAIRAPEVSAAVSAIATNLDVRADLIAQQKTLIGNAVDGIVA
jgi:CMP/dCMP kinase